MIGKRLFIVKLREDHSLVAIFAEEEDCREYIAGDFSMYYDEVKI